MAKKDQSSPFRLPRSPFLSPALSAGDIAAGLLNKVFSDRGFTTREIVTQWETIVGPELADVTAPERLRWPRQASARDDPDAPESYESATLHIRVEGPIAIEVQHLAPQIIERINQFFGYPAIGSIRIIQAPVGGQIRGRSQSDASTRSADLSRAPWPRAEPSKPSPPITGIADPELAAALARLGQRIKRK